MGGGLKASKVDDSRGLKRRNMSSSGSDDSLKYNLHKYHLIKTDNLILN